MSRTASPEPARSALEARSKGNLTVRRSTVDLPAGGDQFPVYRLTAVFGH